MSRSGSLSTLRARTNKVGCQACLGAAVRADITAPAAGAEGRQPPMLDLRAELFGRPGARGGGLARIADERGAAGASRER